MALITLAEYKTRTGRSPAADPVNDDRYQAVLDDASTAILNEYDRDWGAALVTEDREWFYDGSGILNIDDANVVNSVTFQNSAALAGSAWRARKEGPASVQVFSFLELPVLRWDLPTSLGAMGFTRNLDRFLAQPGGFPELTTTVNAEWGWPEVPDDVKRAVVWTAYAWEESEPSSGGAGDLASKSVAEVAESYFAEQQQAQAPPVEAIPARARAVLENYRRHTL